MLGIYYDDPKKVDDSDECRAVVGLLVYEGELDKVQGFVENNKDFQIRRIQKCEMYEMSFPFYNDISFMLLPMIAYPKLKKELEKKNHKEPILAIEYYDLQNAQIRLFVPKTNQEQWMLSRYRTPAWRFREQEMKEMREKEEKEREMKKTS